MDEIERFRLLLDSAKSEREVHRFLEERPYLLLDLFMSPHASVVTQFPLGSDFQLDFAFVHSNSGGNYLDLLELEYPKAKIFNQDGLFSQRFNHALQQVQDGVAWCEKHHEFVLRQIKPLITYQKSDNLYVGGLLVMGRRQELSNLQRQERFEARQHQLPRGLQVRTYDGFAERLEDSQKWPEVGFRSVRCLRYQGQEFVEANLAPQD